MLEPDGEASGLASENHDGGCVFFRRNSRVCVFGVRGHRHVDSTAVVGTLDNTPASFYCCTLMRQLSGSRIHDTPPQPLSPIMIKRGSLPDPFYFCGFIARWYHK